MESVFAFLQFLEDKYNECPQFVFKEHKGVYTLVLPLHYELEELENFLVPRKVKVCENKIETEVA